jgi:hypothetical protein
LYWRNDPQKHALYPCRLYMGLKRFKQIKQYLHVSLPA